MSVVRRSVASPPADADWAERIALLQMWIEEQRIVVAATRAAGQSTKQADLMLIELQRCRDAMRRYEQSRQRS